MRGQTPLARLIATAAVCVAGCFLDRQGIALTVDASPDARIDGRTPNCDAAGTIENVYALTIEDLRTGLASGTSVEDPGVIALPLQPYHRGGFLLIGYASPLLDDAQPDLSMLEGAVPALSTIVPTLEQQFIDPPQGLGVPADLHTMELRGELFLRAGTNGIALSADDRAVLAIAHGEPVPTTVRTTVIGQRVTQTIQVPADGWYAVQAAIEDGFGASGFRIELDDPTDVGFRAIRGDEMRVDLSAVVGRFAIGWDNPEATGSPRGRRIDPARTDAVFGPQRPPELALTSDTYTVRWFGMHRFDAAGRLLAAEVERLHHVWVDGVYFGNGGANGMYDSGFGPGWHEVTFELRERDDADGRARLSYDGAPFESAALRPRSRAGAIVAAAGANPNVEIAIGAREAADLDLRAPPGRPSFVEVSAIVQTDDPQALRVRIDPPNGDNAREVVFASSARRIGTSTRWIFSGLVDDVEVADGRWRTEILNQGASPAIFERAGVLAQIGGTREAYRESGTWESGAIDLGERVDVEALSFAAEIPPRTSLQVSVRVAETASGLNELPYVDVDASGAIHPTSRGRFLQVRTALSGDRTVTPRFSGATVQARRCPP